MQLIVGSVLTVALVLLLIVAIWPAALPQLRELRGAAYMLLIGVPALVLQTDLLAIAYLAGSSMALYEALLILLAF